MPRSCSVCTSPDRGEIDKALVAGELSYRTIADRWTVSKTALIRHKADHLPVHLAKAKEAEEVADADDLLAQVRSLQARALAILDAAEEAGELRTALGAIREARGNLELVGRLTKELDDRPQINLYLSSEWLELRAVLVTALEPYAEARGAVLGALEGAGNGRA